MAQVNKLKLEGNKKFTNHKPTEAKYFVLSDTAGKKYLQIETTGSEDREFKGKVSQSIQFTPDAIRQLKSILDSNF